MDPYRRGHAAEVGALFDTIDYPGEAISCGKPLGQSVVALVINRLFVLPLRHYLTPGTGYICTQKYSP